MVTIDTGYDFLQPEFLNILFFQQKSLVIFPYVDMKHLHSLEIFAAGYNVIDLDSTALHNVREILELEVHNSYSQTPCFFFISNITKEEIDKILQLDNVHCIINTSEVLEPPQEDGSFIFYNKKHGKFLNFTPDDLTFEKELIASSKNESILQDKIVRIKSLATTLYNELNEELTIKPHQLEKFLADYEPSYWDKILDFMQRFYHIEIPKDTLELSPAGKQKKSSKEFSLIDYSDEYHDIVAVNKYIGKEFIQVLHDYRAKKVNPANLELEQLYNPQKVYNYLRNHHWKDGVDKEFLQEWIQMNHTQYELTKDDLADFQRAFSIMKASPDILSNFSLNMSAINHEVKITNNSINNTSIVESRPMITSQKKVQTSGIPPLSNFNQFKVWILKVLDEIEQLMRLNIGKLDREIDTLCSESNNIIIVDICNILNEDKDKEGNIKMENVLKVRETVISAGYSPQMFADASMRYHVDDNNLYERFVKEGIIRQTPAGTKADEYILEFAKLEQCKFVTNDLFKDYREKVGKKWIYQNRVTCMYFNGRFVIQDKK